MSVTNWMMDALRRRFEQKLCYIGDCIVWTGATDRHGYGVVSLTNGQQRAHRVAWELAYGSIPSCGLDHLCQNKICVNIGHLEPVTQKENIRRYWNGITKCKHGHDRDFINSYVRVDGSKQCRKCDANRKRVHL
jgi:hypothetical protein